MNTVLEQMLSKYELNSDYDRVNALKEILQEITLCGLSRGGFFRKAAFYGGTALRMFYGLDRFSEDIDFSLIERDEAFDFSDWFTFIEKESAAYGLNFSVETKKKTKDTAIKSAFLKANTSEHLLLFYDDKGLAGSIPGNEAIKIKLEIDTEPPEGASFEKKYRLLPAPHEINMYDEPSLFAGKLHAVICRNWKSRVKGRDLYDYVFYMGKGARVNLPHLRARLVASGFIGDNDKCEIEDIKRMLMDKFDVIDYRQAREDVIPFIKDPSKLDLWSADFFQQVTEALTD
ncbi:MAG TPA: nucleotidyl transferase AbiEii/AbiGii toxin family protein [Mogibacterium sp.]|nr:nucleotidyl transferase AbiEii/AbiGii toxin family protein [Mogibacterium sp.]